MKNSNSIMFEAIRIQQYNHKRKSSNAPVIVIHPDFYYNVEMMVDRDGRSRLFGMEVNLSTNIESNEFIMGEKFKAEAEF